MFSSTMTCCDLDFPVVSFIWAMIEFLLTKRLLSLVLWFWPNACPPWLMFKWWFVPMPVVRSLWAAGVPSSSTGMAPGL